MWAMAKVISFEERAVASLRDRLGAAQSANEDLIAFARGHSGATAAIHSAVLSLMDASSMDAMLATVCKRWPRLLGLDHAVLALVVEGRGFRIHAKGTEEIEPRLIDRAIAGVEPVTMRGVERGHVLFGAEAGDIHTEVVLILTAESPLPYGLLLLGQKGTASLDNRHGAQLLGFLGASLVAMLRRWLMNR
jgi:uncharacterized protein